MKMFDEGECIKIIADSSLRLDKVIAENVPTLTRSAIQTLFSNGFIQDKDGKPLAKSAKLLVGQEVFLHIPPVQPADILPENIPLQIVYEDADLLVVNKPKGMVVHPAPGHSSGTLVNALMYHCKDSLSGINGVLRPGIVHRIDKDTSGLLIVAKNNETHLSLAEQIQSHSFAREYQAVVYGNVKTDEGKVDAPIGRHPNDRKKMAVITGPGKSRHAVTHYHVVKHYEGFTWLGLQLETGRTHQIRVHMAYLGHPVAGDEVYGPKKVITSLQGQCLHAGLIGFVHPRTHEHLTFTSPLPDYFVTFINKLKEWE